MNYDEFIKAKSLIEIPTGISNPPELNAALFDFQKDITRWALIRGRAAVFAGTGLGKTMMQVEAAKQISEFTKKPVLIFAPLAVAQQTIQQAKEKLEYDILFCSSQDDIKFSGIYITNYQKLSKFDPSTLGGVILDESSCLKGEDAKTRTKLTEDYAKVAFRLCFTATPAPNDFMEIGGHAEFLGVMTTAQMLSTFFVHDGGETQKWRLKGHAESDFWRWMASWCVAIQHPKDLGYEDDRYNLPPLEVKTIIVESPPADGELFSGMATTLESRRSARKSSMDMRIEATSKLCNADSDQWVIWCNLNVESELLSRAINGAVEVKGADDDEHKERSLLGFADGKVSRIITKSSIAGWGMNWQNCNKTVYFPDDSFERYFQAIRRFWRFGQQKPVTVYLVLSESELPILENLKRKEKEAMEMYAELVQHMAELSKQNIQSGQIRTKIDYQPKKQMKLPEWINK